MPIDEFELDPEERFNPATSSPADAAVDYVASTTRVKDTNWVVGLCSECKNTQPEGSMEKSIFAGEGVPPVCRYCGGVVVITYGELQGDRMNRSLDASRGIGMG